MYIVFLQMFVDLCLYSWHLPGTNWIRENIKDLFTFIIFCCQTYAKLLKPFSSSAFIYNTFLNNGAWMLKWQPVLL